MERLNFLFGIHCHQPIGNFDFVFEKSYERAYKPFFEILKEFPEIKIVVHFSGPLIDWFEKNKPDFLEFLKKLIENGQIEILGGGYYEPILPVIPEKDQVAQLKLMKKRCKEIFQVLPEGAWIAERVWEPNLPFVLNKTGYKAIFLDDFHFLSSGLKEEEVFDYFESYHLDKNIYLFPIKEKYRYLIPFAPIEEVFENFKRDSEIYKNSIITMVDDGEKFGIWPGTYKWVWEERWLYKFFEGLKKIDFVKTINLKEALSLKRPRGILHIPTQSYFEMGEWTLPPEKILKYKEFYGQIKKRSDLKDFIKGGYWRNFFDKYEESFWIYQRNIYVSNYLKEKINLNLLMAQCNCGWWHGIFGGLYFPFLRRAIFKNLIEAEKNKKASFYKEKKFFVLRDKKFQIFFIKKYGGVIREIDLLKESLNITDLMRRRIEGYHLEEKKEEEKEHISIHDLSFSIEPSFIPDIVKDPHPHLPLIIHFFDEVPKSLNEILKEEVLKPLNSEGEISNKKSEITIKSKIEETEILKKISVLENQLKIKILIKNILKKYWAVEFPFSLPDGFYKTNNSDYIHFSLPNIFKKEEIFLWDKVTNLRIKVSFGNTEELNIFPLNTIVKCEKGFEKILQGIIIYPVYSNNNAEIKITLEE